MEKMIEKRTSSKKTFTRKKYCFFCKEERTLGTAFAPDYKNVTLLKKFTTERGKIIPKNRSGLCRSHQRDLAQSVKRARELSLIQYSSHL